MEIRSLDELNYNDITQLYNISTPSFVFIPDGVYEFGYYTVKKEEEMRIDLIIKSIYETDAYMKDLDVILYMNNIDNPLNIKEDDELYFPSEKYLDEYRYYPIEVDSSDVNIIEKLSIPNKTTRVDNNRENFIKNGFALPPVVSKQNKIPVTIQNGKIIAGGL